MGGLLVDQVVEAQAQVVIFVPFLKSLDPQHNLVNQVTLEHTVPVMLEVKEEQVLIIQEEIMVLAVVVVEQELQVVKVVLKVRVQVELE